MAFSGGFRAVRTPVMALVASSLGIAAHSAAAATAPAMLPATIVIALACLVAVCLGRRTTSLASITALLVGVQVLAHLVMWVAGEHALHGTDSAALVPTSLAPSTLVPSPTMTAGHLLAAVVAALFLVRLDHLLAMWEMLWRSAARRLHPVAIAATPSGLIVRGRVTHAPHPRFLAHLVVRRGPPMALITL